jgi:hypothetical protein
LNQNPNPYPYPPPNAPYGPPPQQGYAQPQGYPQPPGMPTAEDESNLNTLAICHFIYAGLLALGGLFGVIYVVFGVIIATAAMSGSGATGGAAPPAAIGGLVAMIGGIITLLIWTKGALILYSGLSLKKRRRKTLSLVMACICCVNIPLGTALGVFTLIVLSKPGVKAIYDRVAYYGA